jgi:hypothetical protein
VRDGRRGGDGASIEHMFDKPCLDCGEIVIFDGPGDAACDSCGLRMFLSEKGGVGRYPREDWDPGRMQGRGPASGL